MRGLALVAVVGLALLIAGTASGRRSTPPKPTALSYTLIDLGAATTYAASEALGVNDRGQVIGDSFPVVGPGQSNIEWTVDLKTHSVSSRPSPGGAIPRGFNNAGAALTTAHGSNGGNAAIYWDPEGSSRSIGPAAADGSGNFALGSSINPSGLNNRGEALGVTSGIGAWLFDGASATAFMPPPCDCRFGFSPNAINDKGQVAGSAQSSNGQLLGYITNGPSGPYTSLGQLAGGARVLAAGIDDDGDVVGSASTRCTVNTYQCSVPGMVTHAYISRGGQMTDLGTLPLPEPAGGHRSQADAINKVRDIVGTSDGPPGEDECYGDAVLWRDGKVRNLNDLVSSGPSNLLLTGASDINDNGWIVGEGYLRPVQCGADDVEHAFLLIPTEQRLQLVGLEVNQSIQDLNDSVPLTEGKATYVRAYVQSPGAVPQPAALQLVATQDGAELPDSPLDPVNGTIDAPLDALTVANRTNLGSTVDWRLPPAWTHGNVTLTVQPSPPATGDPVPLECDSPSGGCDIGVHFTPVGELQVEFVGLSWTDGTTTYTATYNDAQTAAQRVTAMFPLADVEWRFVPDSRTPLSMPHGINANPDAHTAEADFLDHLQRIRRLDGCFSPGCNVIYFGLFRQSPLGFPYGNAGAIPNVVGVGAVGQSALALLADTVPHELGHDLGRQHPADLALGHRLDDQGNPTNLWQSPCGAATNDTTTWPYLATLGNQEFSEISPTPGTTTDRIYGLDTTVADADPTHKQGVLDPSIHYELMDYCDQVNLTSDWISPLTYLALRTSLDSLFAPPVPTRRSLASRRTATTPMLLIDGTVDTDNDTVAFVPFREVDTPSGAVDALTGSYSAVLLDAAGNQLGLALFDAVASHSDGPTASLNPLAPFAVVLPDDPAAARVEILHNGAVVGSFDATPHAPTLTVARPAQQTTYAAGDTISLGWRGADADGDVLNYVVAYSADAGATWHTIASGLDVSHLDVQADTLAPTNSGLFRVQASDGFHTTTATSPPVAIADAGPAVTIDSPADHASIALGDSFVASGSAFATADGGLTGAALHWSVDGGAIGTGVAAVVNARTLQLGSHSLTLTATDSQGTSSTVTRRFTIAVPSVAATPPSASPPATPVPPATPAASAKIDVGVQLTAVPAAIEPGASSTDTEVVRNAGGATASGLVLTHTLPPGLVVQRVTATQGQCVAGPTYTCFLGTLASGGSATVTLTVTASSARSYTVTADVTDGNGGVREGGVTLAVVAGAAPRLSFGSSAFTPPLHVHAVGRAAVLSFSLGLNEPAVLRMTVVDPRSRSLHLLAGSYVGPALVGSRATVLTTGGPVADGPIRVHLRLLRTELRAGATYRVHFAASGAGGAVSTLVLRFRR
jgi:uncharacterized repeat protein (TIGR01451 family)